MKAKAVHIDTALAGLPVLRGRRPETTAEEAGAAFTTLAEMGEGGVFAGSFQGRTRTLPLAVYHALESQPAAAIALSMVLLLVSAVVLFLLRRQWFPIR